MLVEDAPAGTGAAVHNELRNKMANYFSVKFGGSPSDPRFGCAIDKSVKAEYTTRIELMLRHGTVAYSEMLTTDTDDLPAIETEKKEFEVQLENWAIEPYITGDKLNPVSYRYGGKHGGKNDDFSAAFGIGVVYSYLYAQRNKRRI
jgi:hypothetical protein